MRRSHAVVAATLLVLTACGGGDDDAAESTGATDGPDDVAVTTDAPSDTTSVTDLLDDVEIPEVQADEHPIIKFAAHGPAEPNTYGPSCSTGIESTASNTLRVTAPEEWVYRGSSGGTGDSDIDFEVGDGMVNIAMATADYDRDLLGVIENVGEAGTVDLAGTEVPLYEVTVDGTPGYAIDQVVWMDAIPEMFGGSMAMTVVLTTDMPDLVTSEEAADVLGSIRVERCAGVSEAMVAMAAVPVLAVPEFDPDPLGKTYPGGEQPPMDMMNAIDVYSTEQVAYLLPFADPPATCVAEALKSELPAVFPMGMVVFSAVQGEQQDALQALADAC